MVRLLQSLAVAISVLGAAGCASTMTVSSHVAHDLDFRPYHTYDWGPADTLPTGDPRLDGNPFFQDHMQGAVEKRLAAKGFEQSTSGTPDLLIHYHASINSRIDAGRVDQTHGFCHDSDCWDRTGEYEAGTLVLDVVDTRTNRVIWRGWAQDTMEGVLDNPDRMARQINEAVTRMLDRFPGGR